MPKANDLLETARMFDQRAEQAKRASIETEGQRLQVGGGEGAAGLRHRGGENPLSGSVAGFAGDISAVLTRQDILTNLQWGPSRRGSTGPTRGNR
jgi:hypothetical protein